MEHLSALRFADLLDIAIVATLLYVAMGWARRIASRYVVAGIVMLAAVYLLARVFDLHLTLYLFQVAIAFAVIAFLIIFQEDIRLSFERLASGQLQNKRRDLDPYGLAGVLTLAVSHLAKRKRGALIVVRGRDRLERHTTGGVPCDGTVTEPLLESLFDPSSAGHDGAAIIDGRLVTRFGVHLPLSTKVSGGRELGTRHAAALGLSERCDALVIVVSEERGTISTAYEARLEELPGAGALRQRLTAFLAWRSRRRAQPLWRRVLRPSLAVKAVLAIALAAGGWMLLLGAERAPTTRTMSAPVVFRNVPAMWMIEDDENRYVEVTISGPSGEFRRLDPSSLAAVVDARHLREGEQLVVVTPDDVEAPVGVTVERVEPPSLRFVASRLETIDARVEPLVRGELPAGHTTKSEPPGVRLVVPARSAKRFEVVHTEPIDAAVLRQQKRVEAALWLPAGARLADEDRERITVMLEPIGPPIR